MPVLSGSISLAESNAYTNKSLLFDTIILKSMVTFGDIIVSWNLQ